MNSTEKCPLCGTELSQTKLVEIQAKIAGQEQQTLLEQKKKLAEAEVVVRRRLEQQFQKDLEQERVAAAKQAKDAVDEEIKKMAVERDLAAKKVKEAEAREVQTRKLAQQEKEAAAKQAKDAADQEIKKIAAERDLAAKKAKEAEAREAQTRKQAQQEKEAAAKQAKDAADQEIKKITAERDQAAKKVKEVEAREAETLKRAQQEADKNHQKELAQQRTTLEKDRDARLIKQQAEFNRERESLQKKAKTMEQQLQKKTANELGDGAEIDLFEALREAFTGDQITRVQKGQPGADILLEVLYKGQTCGRIIIDSKNRQGWQNVYVTKLRQDQVEARAEQAILASAAFPEGKKEMCIESGVIVVSPARVVHIVQILRQAMITMHVRGLSIKERAGKMSRLYELITSESYSRRFSEAGKLTKDILDLDVQEKKAHDNVWKKRGTVATRINYVLREIETEVAAVIEGEDTGEGPAAYGVQRAKAAS